MVFNYIQFAISSKAVGKIVGNDVWFKFLVLKCHEYSSVITFVIQLFLWDFFIISVIKICGYVSLKIITKMVDIKNVLPFFIPCYFLLEGLDVGFKL